MAMQTNLEALIEVAKHLSDEERKKLVEALHPRSESPQPRHIAEMRGLGKDLWQGIDPQDYLNAERDSWDN
jgi:tripartite-type tricarboxylate transporter receptor subunit TctC